jgi:hypothetical protein
MQIYTRVIDDFKTERKDITSPLPAYLRLVPVLFYLSLLAGILLNALFFTLSSQASRAKESAVREEKKITADLEAARKQRQDLENETKRASDLIAWIETARPLQPLAVEIARSIGEGATLNEILLQRSEENPSQILLTLRLKTDNPKQLDNTLQVIAENSFRTFSPQQTMDKGETEYRATLLWQNSSQAPSSSIQ